jgi:hypothetical protein
MTLRHYLAAYACAVIIWGMAALPFTSPTYFDSFYYFNAAESLASGHGLTDRVLWNFLDDPAGLPRPSHLYWMPLASLLPAVGIRLFGGMIDHWRAAQAIMLPISALLVPLAMWLSWSLWQRREFALVAGILMVFSGNYLGIWSFADSYGPWALAVTVALLAAWRADRPGRTRWWLLAGVASGFAYLARADGLLVAALLASLAMIKRDWRGLAILTCGCALVITPWSVRNLIVVGRPLPLAGSKTLWLRDYPEIFSYGIDLSPARYFSWGLITILRSKLQAGLNTIESALGAWPVLAPFAVLGLWSKRGDLRLRLTGGYWVALWAVMVFVFTFPAQRGSLYHSMAALAPWQAAVVPGGIAAANRWLHRRWHRWPAERFTRFFLGWLLFLAFVFSCGVYLKGALAAGVTIEQGGRLANHWQDSYLLVDAWLTELQVPPGEPVVTTDPPVFNGITGRRAVVLPLQAGAAIDFAALDQVALRYGARCLVLDGDAAEAFDQGLQAKGWPMVRHTDVRGQPISLFCRQRAGAPSATSSRES